MRVHFEKNYKKEAMEWFQQVFLVEKTWIKTNPAVETSKEDMEWFTQVFLVGNTERLVKKTWSGSHRRS